MFDAQADSPDFTLAVTISDSDTSIEFLDLTDLLPAPNLITIRTDDSDVTPETIYYPTDPTGNTISGVTRGYGGTTAKSFIAGALACRANTAEDHRLFKANILDLASAKQNEIVVGTVTDVEDGVAVTYSPGGTPRALILVPVCSGADLYMTFMQFVSLETFSDTQFIANIKTNTGSSGNPMTLTWIAVM